MKRILILLFVLGLIFQSSAYDKKSLVERFTNASCGPCAALNNEWYNAVTQRMVSSGSISHIVYNVNWPGANDPMYLLNSADNMARRSYYGVTWVPWPIVNSIYFDYQTMDSTQFVNTVNAGNAEFAPFNIIVSQGVISNNLIEVAVKIIRDPTDVTTFGNVKLRVAITEKTVDFGSPPGSNGESVFYSVCRKMMPDAGGSSFTVPDPGDSVMISLSYVPTSEFLQAVNLDSMRIVAFIQDDNTKEIYQSKMHDLNRNYMATINTFDKYYFGTSSGSAEYTAYIKNIGLFPDTYNITLDFDGPAGWSQTFTTVNGTFNLGEADTVTINPGDSSSVQINVSANSINGYGKTTIQFLSNQGSFGKAEFRFTTFGLNILVVDDDGGNDYENYMESELISLASDYGVIPSDFILANVGSINTFDIIIWNTAATEPGLSEDEMNALITFLDNGGNLYLNGADLAYQMADPTSAYYTGATHSFFNNYLHSSYLLREHSARIAVGIDGDPITDSLAMMGLTGGTGANTINHSNGKYVNQISANGTDAYDILHLWLKPDEYAGVRSLHNGTSGTSKVVFTPFGFETIALDEIRSFFAGRLINWLSTPTDVEEDPSSGLPITFELSQNYPNPFNPATNIKFSIPETSPVTIKVFDVLGNEIALLLDEVKSAGTYKITYDASGNASGIYFYQMKAGNFISVKKMSILK